jgi:hypothetical protein
MNAVPFSMAGSGATIKAYNEKSRRAQRGSAAALYIQYRDLDFVAILRELNSILRTKQIISMRKNRFDWLPKVHFTRT